MSLNLYDLQELHTQDIYVMVDVAARRHDLRDTVLKILFNVVRDLQDDDLEVEHQKKIVECVVLAPMTSEVSAALLLKLVSRIEENFLRTIADQLKTTINQFNGEEEEDPALGNNFTKVALA